MWPMTQRALQVSINSLETVLSVTMFVHYPPLRHFMDILLSCFKDTHFKSACVKTQQRVMFFSPSIFLTFEINTKISMQITQERLQLKPIFTPSIQPVQQLLTFALSALYKVVNSSCLLVVFLYCIYTHLNSCH